MEANAAREVTEIASGGARARCWAVGGRERVLWTADTQRAHARKKAGSVGAERRRADASGSAASVEADTAQEATKSSGGGAGARVRAGAGSRALLQAADAQRSRARGNAEVTGVDRRRGEGDSGEALVERNDAVQEDTKIAGGGAGIRRRAGTGRVRVARVTGALIACAQGKASAAGTASCGAPSAPTRLTRKLWGRRTGLRTSSLVRRRRPFVQVQLARPEFGPADGAGLRVRRR